MTRAEAIEILKKLMEAMQVYATVLPTPERIAAIRFAIASLETDEAYQLEYEQPEFCADCISRAEVLKLMKDNWHTHNGDWAMQESLDDIRSLPSVTPQEPKTGHCRDCKWWKDSDGAYRRGVGAESQCPINRREVFEGNGYCYMFEPQESEG